MKTLYHGLTSILILPRKTRIIHTGNMGNTLKDIKENVDRLLGEGIFDELRKVGREEGSPDYMYTLHVRTKEYEKIVGVDLETV